MAYKRKNDSVGTICWSCARSLPGRGCSWADNFVPVKDWIADSDEKKDSNNRLTKSYCVKECPLYLQGRYKEKYECDPLWLGDINLAKTINVTEREMDQLKELPNPYDREAILRRYL